MAKIIKVGGEFYRRTTRSYAVAVTGADPLADLRKSLVDALGSSAADELLGKVSIRPRSSGKSIRAARAAGDGGTCPYFGLDYETSEGIHHPADCGKEHDGKFAKTGDAIKGTGYLGHIEWAGKGAPALKKVKPS